MPEQSKSIITFIDGAKILLPFIVTVASVVWVAADAQTERQLLQQRLNINEQLDAAQTAKIDAFEKTLTDHSIMFARFDEKLSNIENDAKETLELVRDLRGVN